ncbi:hematopoietic SH2 domain-containing protein [Thomomys bottae]
MPSVQSSHCVQQELCRIQTEAVCDALPDPPQVAARPPHVMMEAGKPTMLPSLPPRLDWFLHTQVAQLTEDGFPEWFHGAISREAAENLLESHPVGAFLVRVSHSHVGYTLSYKAPSCCRHFMVKLLDDGSVAIPGGEAHASLDALVTCHRRTPLRPHGDLLTQPCPQEDPAQADYEDLLHWYTLAVASPDLGPRDPGSPSACLEEGPPKPLVSPQLLERKEGEPSPSDLPKGIFSGSRKKVWKSLKALPEVGRSIRRQLQCSFLAATPPPLDSQTWTGSVEQRGPRGATTPCGTSSPPCLGAQGTSSRRATRSSSWNEMTTVVSRWHRSLVRALSSPVPQPAPPELAAPQEAWLPEEYLPPPPFAPGYY